MCGRYTLTTQKQDLAAELDLDPGVVLDLEPRWNIAPTQEVPILLKDEGVRMALYRWGLVPPWAKDPTVGSRMINARSETLAERASCRDALRSQRCLVLADGFYEWHAGEEGQPKVPHYIRLKSRKPFTFAGLWAKWRGASGQDLYTCTIITGDANELVGKIHHRMPIVIPPANRDAWLDPDHGPAAGRGPPGVGDVPGEPFRELASQRRTGMRRGGRGRAGAGLRTAVSRRRRLAPQLPVPRSVPGRRHVP